MELIQIIYNILLFGGGFVLIIMITSFLLSKAKAQELPYERTPEKVIISDQIIRSRVDYQNQVASILPTNQLQWEQGQIRNQSVQSKPQIFPIDQKQQREVKIVRKPTVRETARTKETEAEKKVNGKRYTIVNEDQKKSNSRVINFYL